MAEDSDDFPTPSFDYTDKAKLMDALQKVGVVSTPSPVAVKQQSGLVHDDIKIGMHVKLKCGCEGFVKDISSSEMRDERWFSVLNTKAGCRAPSGLISLEGLYAEMPGKVKVDTYHADTFSRILPAFETPAPSWFKSINDVPKSANERRAIRVRLADTFDFIIPGALMSMNVYVMATLLRGVMKGNAPDIEVIENIEGIDSDHLGKAPEIFKKLCVAKNQTIDEKNVSIFYNWAISMLYSSGEGETLSEMGTSMLSRDMLRTVLGSIQKHPMWKGNRIEINAKEGYVVILGQDGKIS